MARALRLGMVIAPMAILLSAGCDSRPSLTLPTKDVSRSSAQLNGTFTSLRGSAQGLRAFSQTGLDEITVEVEGTNITTQVRSDGSFTLRGLPEGSFKLFFRDKNGAVIGEIDFGNILSGQSIEILLRLEEDGSVTLLEERRDGVVLEGNIVSDDDSSDDNSSDDDSSDDNSSDDNSSDDNSSDDNSSGQEDILNLVEIGE